MDETITQLLTLVEKEELEEQSKELSLPQTMALFRHLAQHPDLQQQKLPPIVAGIPLAHLPPVILYYFFLLKPLAKSEVLHHKLARFAEVIQQTLLQMQHEEEVLALEIRSSTISKETFEPLQERLKALKEALQSLQPVLKQSLELVWLSERDDIIPLYDGLKISAIHQEQTVQLLMEELKSQMQSIFIADNKASPLEALAELGYLYPEDFHDLLTAYGIKEQALEEPLLLRQVEDMMRHVGLNSVGAFKEWQIFSKEKLFKFLKREIPSR